MAAPVLLTFSEAAKRIKMPEAAVRAAAEEHGFVIAMGRSRRVMEAELGELVEKCRSRPKAPASTSESGKAAPRPGSSEMAPKKPRPLPQCPPRPARPLRHPLGWPLTWDPEGPKTVYHFTIPEAVREEVMRRDGEMCRYCGSENGFRIDHVMPISRGGTHALTNLVACCPSCNSSKRDRTPEEWDKKNFDIARGLQ